MAPNHDQLFINRLNQHPQLRERMEILLNVVENEDRYATYDNSARALHPASKPAFLVPSVLLPVGWLLNLLCVERSLSFIFTTFKMVLHCLGRST